MIPLESVNHETFTPLLGETFRVITPDASRELSLAGVKLIGHKRDDAAREPFSLVFLGPQGLRLPQGTYPFSSRKLGEIEIFITQIADGAKGSEFEAVFT